MSIKKPPATKVAGGFFLLAALTRENVMKQAASLKDFAPDTLIPGIKINTSATDYAPIEQLQMMRFKGGKWELFGDIISAEQGS